MNNIKRINQIKIMNPIYKTIGLFVVLCSTPVLAIDADFSKSFVVPEKSKINRLTLGGVDATGNSYSVDFSLQKDLSLAITDAVIQDSLSEKLEQNLRNTTWEGTYEINNDIFTTTLTLFVVQNGYVGGEVIHSEPASEGDGYLHSRVTGDIVTQFEVDGEFIDEDRVSKEILEGLAENTPHRQLIRIKRMRTLEFRNDTDGSSWNTNREYRLILENGALSGVVGVPSSTIGTDDGTDNEGDISLVQK
ncbi:MAG: hypothetical protein L3J59_07885 [Methylococcaceae bacterium]|nr:hypothetical protein [Methylococcaceae bacterium]